MYKVKYPSRVSIVNMSLQTKFLPPAVIMKDSTNLFSSGRCLLKASGIDKEKGCINVN